MQIYLIYLTRCKKMTDLYSSPFCLCSTRVRVWRHPLSAEWVGEHHHRAAAPRARERGSCQVQLIHGSLLRQHSFRALPHRDIYSHSQKELSRATGSSAFWRGGTQIFHFKSNMWRICESFFCLCFCLSELKWCCIGKKCHKFKVVLLMFEKCHIRIKFNSWLLSQSQYFNNKVTIISPSILKPDSPHVSQSYCDW